MEIARNALGLAPDVGSQVGLVEGLGGFRVYGLGGFRVYGLGVFRV